VLAGFYTIPKLEFARLILNPVDRFIRTGRPGLPPVAALSLISRIPYHEAVSLSR
jgi:hypothetical protein